MAYKLFDPAENNFLSDNNNDTMTGQNMTLSYNEQDSLDLPDESYVRDADFSREGMDLVLETNQGTLTIENYFADATPPNLVAPNGITLTPELVNSFTQGGQQYADAGNSMNDASPIGAVQEISGDVTVTRTNGTVETASIGTPIYQGDVVETDEEGAVNIIFVDETTFAVSEDARLAIDEYVFDPATQSGTSNFSVLKGVFVFTSGLIGRDDPDDVEIDTPSGSIGIRGTIIAGDVDTGEITVIEGAIVLRDFSGNSVTLSNQYETAKFMPESNTIEHMGEMAASDVVVKFTSVSNVNGTLFSSIQDSAADNQDNTQPAQGANDPVDAQSGEETTEDGSTDDTQSDAGGTTSEMITSEEIVKAGTSDQNDKPFEQAEDSIIADSSDNNADSPDDADATTPQAEMSEPSAVFSVTLQRIEVQENNDGVVEVAIIRGHFTTGMTLQLNGQSQNYYDVVQIDALNYSIRTKPGVSLDENTYNIINFTAVDVNGYVVSQMVDLDLIDDFEIAQFISNAPNVVGDENAFAASDNGNWIHDFSHEFSDPDGQIATYSYELYDSTATLISTFPTAEINGITLANNGVMLIDFGDITTDTYTLVVHAYDADNNLIDSTSGYTFETWDTNSTNTSLGNSEIVSFAGNGTDTIIIGGDDNRVFTDGGADNVIITGNTNFVYTGSGNDTIVYNSGTGNNVFTGGGNDLFTIQTGGVAALNSGASNLYFDGGSGEDKIAFTTGGAIDFTAINDTYLHNIEKISTEQVGPQTNTITLSRTDVLNMTDGNNTVIINMDTSDTFDFVNDVGTTFIYQGTETIDGDVYARYTDTTVTLLVDTQGTMAAGSDLP